MELVSGQHVSHAADGALTGWKNLMHSHSRKNLLKVEQVAFFCVGLLSDLFRPNLTSIFHL